MAHTHYTLQENIEAIRRYVHGVIGPNKPGRTISNSRTRLGNNDLFDLGVPPIAAYFETSPSGRHLHVDLIGRDEDIAELATKLGLRPEIKTNTPIDVPESFRRLTVNQIH